MRKVSEIKSAERRISNNEMLHFRIFELQSNQTESCAFFALPIKCICFNTITCNEMAVI